MRISSAIPLLVCCACWTSKEDGETTAPIETTETTALTETTSPTETATSTPHFAFQSNLLLNLHHFLYQCAKMDARRDGERVPGRPVTVAEMDAVDALTGADSDAWLAGIDFYRSDAIARDLLFDGTLHTLKGVLVDIEDPNGEWIWPADLDSEYESALRAALPVYEQHFWPAHDSRNRAWVATAMEHLARYEESLVERVIGAYGGAWPPAPVRIDVCTYANWAGAYTSRGPTHVTLSSADPNLQGHFALEVLVHEVAHSDELVGALAPPLTAAFEQRGAEIPRDLWHVLIFATSGGAVQRTLAADGIEGYEHYGVRTGLYSLGTWAALSQAVEEPWEAFLDGRVDRETALARIAEALS